MGIAADSHIIDTDALIIGAGPVGLFQVFQLGLLEIKSHVVDSLPYPGGQCVELYADKPIYDIPAQQVCTGQELTDRLLKQIQPFAAPIHLNQVVRSVNKRDDGRFDVETSLGNRFLSKTIFIAGGVGAFQPKPLRVDGIDAFLGKQLFYRVDEQADFAGQHLVVVGGDDAAVQCALDFVHDSARRAASVTLIHRRDDFKSSPENLARLMVRRGQGDIRFIAGQVTGFDAADGKLNALRVTDPDDTTHAVPLDALVVLFGLSPKLGPIADWGLEIERKQLVVDTEKFSTSVPGIFAVGDINTYPGKKKLILCGFHECVLAAFGAASIVFPAKAVHLQYTTTSPRLHALLGVSTPSAD
jgi:thioredoxin reductase (NADPH)